MLSLPSFVRAALDRVGEPAAIMIGAHESDSCLSAFDQGFVPALFAEAERRRLLDESAGLPRELHHGRARRTFGLLEEAPFDRSGRVRLAGWMRRRAGIAGKALLVGTGPTFEIWDPDLALRSGDPALGELAGWHLADTIDTE